MLNEATSLLDVKDEELARRVAQGDKGAFSTLYDRYASAVFAVAVMILGRSEADEVVQEVFIRFWRKGASFDPARGAFRPWLMAVARNYARDQLRHRQRQAHRETAEPLAEELFVGNPANDILDDIWISQQHKIVLVSLQALPPAQREVILMAYFGGKTQQAIADELDLPLGTVKKRIRLGMQKLRKGMNVVVGQHPSSGVGGNNHHE